MGAPMTAVTMPTGNSPRTRAPRSARMRKAPPKMAESGSTSRALGPTSSRTTCGHDESHEADQACQGHRSGRHQRRQAKQDGPLAPHVHAEMLRRVVAQQQAVHRACPRHDEQPSRRG